MVLKILVFWFFFVFFLTEGLGKNVYRRILRTLDGLASLIFKGTAVGKERRIKDR